MTYTSKLREVGASSASCCDCSWKWIPHATTPRSGTDGARHAVMAAKKHGESKHHRVEFVRSVYYDYSRKVGKRGS